MGDQLVLLGTGTCQLQQHRRAASVLIERGGLRVVYDLGRGIADRLAELGLRQDALEHVVISHFHPDHFLDLVALLHAGAWSRIDPRRRDLHVYASGEVVRRLRSLVEVIGRASLLGEGRFEVSLHEVREGPFEIAGRPFLFTELPPAGNHGLKFEGARGTVAITGDSDFHEREAAFLRGAQLAVIDAGHISDEEIVRLAVRTQARRLVCSHLYRELDEGGLNEEARRAGYEGRILVGADGMRFRL